jgi:hypothetical protein
VADPGSNDGILMVQLAQWGAMSGIQDATGVVFDPEFNPDTAGPHDDVVRKVLMWGETLGTLTKNGLISQDLILDWIWVAGLWDRVSGAAHAAREETGEPKLFENFEALAGAQAKQ